MTAELSERGREIVAAARELLEEGGSQALSMRRLADRLGIQAPSLYAHFENKEGLEAALISEGFEEWAALARTATRDGADKLAALGRGYREFATSHPHLYRLMTERPLPRELLRPGTEERGAQPVLEAVGGEEDLARAFWSFAHGMTINELNGRFPEGADLDAAWECGLRAFGRLGSRA